MQTLGIDLSTDPKKVWICEIDWSSSPPAVTQLMRLSDVADPLAGERAAPVSGSRSRLAFIRDEESLIAELVSRIVEFAPSRERMIAVDVPLGWPVPFVEAVAGWDAGTVAFRKRPGLRLRSTDRFVQTVTRVSPPSVSADRTGSTTMLLAEVLSRCAERLGTEGFDRVTGGSGIAETHPMAVLRSWTDQHGQPLVSSSYKGPSNLARETALVRLVAAGVAIDADLAELVAAHDDALDALTCALVARAVALGGTLVPEVPVEPGALLPRPGDGRTSRVGDSVEAIAQRLDTARGLQADAQQLAAREGWIHLPAREPIEVTLGIERGGAPAWVPAVRPWEPGGRLDRWRDEEDDWLDERFDLAPDIDIDVSSLDDLDPIDRRAADLIRRAAARAAD